MADQWQLRLFTSSGNPRSRAAEAAVREACKDRLGEDGFSLEVIDVFEHPERAEAEQVIAVPTLDVLWPSSGLRLIGDLANVEVLTQRLGLPRGSLSALD